MWWHCPEAGSGRNWSRKPFDVILSHLAYPGVDIHNNVTLCNFLLDAHGTLQLRSIIQHLPWHWQMLWTEIESTLEGLTWELNKGVVIMGGWDRITYTTLWRPGHTQNSLMMLFDEIYELECALKSEWTSGQSKRNFSVAPDNVPDRARPDREQMQHKQHSW